MPQQKPMLVLAVCVIGAAMWWVIPRPFVPVPVWAWLISLAALVACAVPSVAAKLLSLIDRLRNPSPRNRFRTACAIAVLSCIYLAFTAHRQDRDFFAKTLDDQSYVIQMRMLAQGKLWMPQHASADFFDTFHMVSEPKYASAYFSGTALLYVPLIWLKVPIWIGPILVAGAILGLIYSIITELTDGVAGAIAVSIIISSNWFRMLSILVYGQTVALLLGLLMFWAWLRWRESYQRKWALLIGVFAGFLAITRPADAICYAIPIGVVLLVDLKRRTLSCSTDFQPAPTAPGMHGLETRATSTRRMRNPSARSR